MHIHIYIYTRKKSEKDKLEKEKGIRPEKIDREEGAEALRTSTWAR